MNERIFELAEQCTISCVDGRGVELNEIDVEKFAELIVRECTKIVESYSKANMESDSWVEMLSMMQKEIKEHFGVNSENCNLQRSTSGICAH